MCVEHDDAESTIRVRVSNSLTAHLLDVVSRVRRLFDVDAEPLVIAKHLAVDPALEASLQRAPGLRVRGAFDHFETAVWAVLGQHVSLEVASELEERAEVWRPWRAYAAMYLRESLDPGDLDVPLELVQLRLYTGSLRRWL